MARRRKRRGRSRFEEKRRRRRVRGVLERVVLGAVMGAVAFVAERVMMRALRKSGKGTEAPREIQLSSTPGKVGQKPQR